jgi:hypothetical protein
MGVSGVMAIKLLRYNNFIARLASLSSSWEHGGFEWEG